MGTHRRTVADAVTGRRKARAVVRTRRAVKAAIAGLVEQDATDQEAVTDLRTQLEETVSTAPEITARLRAIADHLDTYPNLAPTMAHVSVLAGITLQPYDSGSDLGLLAAWARTVDVTRDIWIPYISEEGSPQLYLRGTLAGGAEVTVIAVVDVDEADLLAANVRVERDATFPVELLLRLVEPAAAEAVSR